MKQMTLGIDLGGTKVALGLFDENFTILANHTYQANRDDSSDDFLQKLTQAIDVLISDTAAHTLCGIGIGAPGILDVDQPYIYRAPNAPYLNQYPICGKLTERYEVPVHLDNDANAAALAEYYLGAGKGYPDMIYSTISTGIGAGILIGGTLLHGSYLTAGEIGHTIISTDGPLCGCGNYGCVEAYAGGANFPKQIEARIKQGERTMMAQLWEEYGEINGQVLANAYGRGDRMAKEFMGKITWALGTLYYNLYCILGNNCFVLGGGLTNIGPPLFDGIEHTFQSLRKGDSNHPVHFKKAKFSSSEIGIYGAALLALGEQQTIR